MKIYIPKIRWEKNGLLVRIEQLEQKAAEQGLTETELNELKGLEEIRKGRKIDPKIIAALATIVVAGVTVYGKIFAVGAITAYEAADQIVTSAAFKEV